MMWEARVTFFLVYVRYYKSERRNILKENRFYKRVCTKSMVALMATFVMAGTVLQTQNAYAVNGNLKITGIPLIGSLDIPATININQEKSASDTISGSPILEHHNFETENKTKQVLVTSPTTEDSLFKFNSTFQMKQSQSLIIATLWGALLKPDLSDAATLAELAKAQPGGATSYVDLKVTLDDRLSYTDANGLIQKAYFTSETWRPVYIFDSQYNQLADVKDTYVENVARKEFDIPTHHVKEFIIRVVPIANKTFSAAQQDTPMSFGFDTEGTNNFKVSAQDANAIAANRRMMTDDEKTEEKRIVEKDLNMAANKLTPTEIETLRKYNIFVTGEIGGKVWGGVGRLILSADVNNILPPAGVAVTFANPEVTFMKNIETDVTKDKIASVYADYNKTIPNDTLTDQNVPANPTRDGYIFVGWSENKDSKTADFDPETAVITENKTVYAIWSQGFNVTYNFEKQQGVTLELPQAIQDRLADKNKIDVLIGSEVDTQGIDTSEYEDKDNKGVWTFVSWDKEKATVMNADVVFKGTWDFKLHKYELGDPETPDKPILEIRTATYVFKEKTGKDLPQVLKDRLANTNVLGVDGQEVNVSAIDTSSYTDQSGTWTFIAWDKEKAAFNKENLVFVGEWVFTPIKDETTTTTTITQKPKPIIPSKQTTTSTTTMTMTEKEKPTQSTLPHTGDVSGVSTILFGLSAILSAIGLSKKSARKR
ncbi:LPXTG cell wall anchor domain-containing protein [Granulicatella sp. zg-84]|nr:LPXTG cell wall anchor domain-containing protein [Granulicatella sp. zg-84]